MGARLLYSWILSPLILKKEIDERLDIVDKFFQTRMHYACEEKLEGIK